MRRPILSLALLLAAACAADQESSAPPAEPAPELLPALAADGVRAALVAGAGGSFALRLDVQGEPIGSLQGELTFDPAVLVVSAVVPLSGAYTAVNTDDLSTGRLRFAMFSPGAIASGSLLQLKVVTRGALSRAMARVRLEAAGTLEAAPLDRAQLHHTEGVYRVEP